MIYAKKCILSHHPEKYCEFARDVRNETHCILLLEWWPEDMNVIHLRKCAADMLSRDKLAHRNRMRRKKVSATKKNVGTKI